MPATIDWPTTNSEVPFDNGSFIASVVADADVDEVILKCYPSDGSEWDVEVAEFGEAPGFGGTTVCLLSVALNPWPAVQTAFTIQITWIDDEGNSGTDEADFYVEPPDHLGSDATTFPLTVVPTNITKPATGSTWPSNQNFNAYGPLSAARASAPATSPCAPGYPCLHNNATSYVSFSLPGTFLVSADRWAVVYPSIPAGSNYTIEMLDVDGHHPTNTNITFNS
jgi:hypothetical protein